MEWTSAGEHPQRWKLVLRPMQQGNPPQPKDRQVIPDAAVEATARMLAETCDPLGDWDKQEEAYRGIYRRRVMPCLKAAAPHMRRTVASVAELDSLRDGDIIISDEGGVFEREHGWWRATGSRDPMASSEICTPALVIHE